MASLIKINPGLLSGSVAGLNKSTGNVSNVTQNVTSVYHGLSYQVKQKNNINQRMSSAVLSLHDIELKMSRIKTFVGQSADKYQTIETYLNRQASNGFDKNPIVSAVLDNRIASNLFDLHENTIGRWEHFITSAKYAGSAGLLHMLGWRYIKDANGTLQFKLIDSIRKGSRALPLGTFIRSVEGSKLHFLSKVMASPYHAVFNRKKLLSEIVYKKYTNQFPGDIAKLTNSVRDLRANLKGTAGIMEGMTAVKNSAGTIGKAALKVGRANFVTALVVTGAVESIGATIKISENYSKYSGDVNKLKEENAKIVGEALYKTAVVTGTTVAGAAVGGAVGSLLGPAGTVVGAAVGGFVGSWVGDKIAQKTPGWVEKGSLHFKDEIFKGTEAVANKVAEVKQTFSGVKDGFNDVKNNAANLLQNSKNILGKLSFGG
jgi:hypothetical protein